VRARQAWRMDVFCNYGLRRKYRAVVRYEWARGTPGTDIHSCLVEVYVPNIMSMEMVRRWCQQFRDGRTSVLDDVKSGRPATATGEENITSRVEELIQWDRHQCRMLLQDTDTTETYHSTKETWPSHSRSHPSA
jgi:transposase